MIRRLIIEADCTSNVQSDIDLSVRIASLASDRCKDIVLIRDGISVNIGQYDTGKTVFDKMIKERAKIRNDTK